LAGIQEGIYYTEGSRPESFFGLLFLRADHKLNAHLIGEKLQSLWKMYQDLKTGIIRDLPEHPVPAGNLTILIGYGPNIFKLSDTKRPPPADLNRFGLFISPNPSGGGPFLQGSGLKYADDVRSNLATEDVVIQFIAKTQLAVYRTVVETWKHIHDMPLNPNTGTTPLLLTSFYTGFQRDDDRSWLDFHDGVSNMKAGAERHGAIAIKHSAALEDQWTENGTYLAFLRLGIDLRIWRKISRLQQEILVGRDKLSGCPLIAIDDNGNPVISNGCPAPGTLAITDPGNEQFRETPHAARGALTQSHIVRAHPTTGPADDESSSRVFRQGYEFIEPSDTAPGFRTGLNFVSFQDTPRRLHRILTTPGWLGKTNFGGDPEKPFPGMDQLISVRAAGVYLVPPVKDGEPFPGSSILL
jgi:deferrochelatase/peroxidase EfeB